MTIKQINLNRYLKFYLIYTYKAVAYQARELAECRRMTYYKKDMNIN